jgi:hypothetical protein
MTALDFGGCGFKYSALDEKLLMHTRDLYGIEQTHAFPLTGAFLVQIGGEYWRFVTGVGKETETRYIFDDTGLKVKERVDALHQLGVPILGRNEGKLNLEQYKLPVKRLMLAP